MKLSRQILFAFLGLFPSVIFGQNCELLMSVLKHATSNEYIILSNEIIKYDFERNTDFYKREIPRIKKELLLFFPEPISDSLINVIQQASIDLSEYSTWDECTNDYVRMVNQKKVEKILKSNNLNRKNKRTEAVCFLTDPIFYKDYAIIQQHSFVRSNNASGYLFLFKKVDDKWFWIHNLHVWVS